MRKTLRTCLKAPRISQWYERPFTGEHLPPHDRYSHIHCAGDFTHTASKETATGINSIQTLVRERRSVLGQLVTLNAQLNKRMSSSDDEDLGRPFTVSRKEEISVLKKLQVRSEKQRGISENKGCGPFSGSRTVRILDIDNVPANFLIDRFFMQLAKNVPAEQCLALASRIAVIRDHPHCWRRRMALEDALEKAVVALGDTGVAAELIAFLPRVERIASIAAFVDAIRLYGSFSPAWIAAAVDKSLTIKVFDYVRFAGANKDCAQPPLVLSQPFSLLSYVKLLKPSTAKTQLLVALEPTPANRRQALEARWNTLHELANGSLAGYIETQISARWKHKTCGTEDTPLESGAPERPLSLLSSRSNVPFKRTQGSCRLIPTSGMVTDCYSSLAFCIAEAKAAFSEGQDGLIEGSLCKNDKEPSKKYSLVNAANTLSTFTRNSLASDPRHTLSLDSPAPCWWKTQITSKRRSFKLRGKIYVLKKFTGWTRLGAEKEKMALN